MLKVLRRLTREPNTTTWSLVSIFNGVIVCRAMSDRFSRLTIILYMDANPHSTVHSAWESPTSLHAVKQMCARATAEGGFILDEDAC